jgi:hypothetical protein
MSAPELAAQHLQTIRSLMERAAIYRAISAPSALIGGLLSLGAAGAAVFAATYPWFTVTWLLWLWGGVLSGTLSAHAIFLWRESCREQRPIWSPAFRLALRSALPLIILSGIWLIAYVPALVSTAPNFIVMGCCLLYGLILLSTQSFAPRSVIVLGWAFFLAGCLMIPVFALAAPRWFYTQAAGSAGMGLTFGLFHLLYAVMTWPRKVNHP